MGRPSAPVLVLAAIAAAVPIVVVAFAVLTAIDLDIELATGISGVAGAIAGGIALKLVEATE